MKKLSILVYPEFSIQEVSDIMYLFRWYFDTKTEIVSTSLDPVISEEGVSIMPNITTDDYDLDNYHCLILPGCSDFRDSIRDEKLISFLSSFNDNSEFIIGAICSAPIFLAKAGLLKGKKYINNLYMDFNERISFIELENRVLKPIVVDGNIITAAGSEGRKFAIEVARKLGFECSDKALTELGEDYKNDDFIAYLNEDQLLEVEKEFGFLFDSK